MSTNHSIWILEDDRGCAFVYEECLSFQYQIKFLTSLAEFKTLREKAEKIPDLLAADLKLADGNFLEYLTSQKNKRLFSVPFIVVSSVDEIESLRLCFDGGAIDYLIKPFKKSELLIKIERALRKKEHDLNIARLQSMQLTQKEQKIHNLFYNSKDRPISRSEILGKVWDDVKVHPKTLDVHLCNLRRKIVTSGVHIRSNGDKKWFLVEQPGY